MRWSNRFYTIRPSASSMIQDELNNRVNALVKKKCIACRVTSAGEYNSFFRLINRGFFLFFLFDIFDNIIIFEARFKAPNKRMIRNYLSLPAADRESWYISCLFLWSKTIEHCIGRVLYLKLELNGDRSPLVSRNAFVRDIHMYIYT